MKRIEQSSTPLWDITMEMVSELPGVYVSTLSSRMDADTSNYRLEAAVYWAEPREPEELVLPCVRQ